MSDERVWTGTASNHCWHCPLRGWEHCTNSCISEWNKLQQERAAEGVTVTGGDFKPPSGDWK